MKFGSNTDHRDEQLLFRSVLLILSILTKFELAAALIYGWETQTPLGDSNQLRNKGKGNISLNI